MIYNGPSIYKFGGGGGGGGYKDGGQLIDGDFIKVENNTVSSYDNVNRDPVNFYFEVTDGEVLNSVIEFTTAVNATVKVYIYQNGLFIPLGNVGGDTVSAGDDYKINIVGNSYNIEIVTPSQAVPDYVEINGNVYAILNVNGLLWLKDNFKGAIENVDYGTYNGVYYYELNALPEDFNINGWRLPTVTEQTDLLNFCGIDSDTFVSTMNIGFYGYQSSKNDNVSFWGSYGFLANRIREIAVVPPAVSTAGYRTYTRYNLRLVKEL